MGSFRAPSGGAVDCCVRSFVVFLALRHVRSRALQSAITVAGVAVGVMVLIVALSLTNGFVDELVRSTLRATPHVTLQSFVAGETLPRDDATIARIAALDGVEAVAPFLSGQALIARRASASLGVSARQGYAQIVGVDLDRHPSVLDLPQITLARDALEQEGGIVLGASLAAQLGVWTGDTVVLREIGGRTLTLDVAGTFRVGNELIDSVTAYTSIGVLQGYLDAGDRITGYHVRVHRPEEASAVGERLGLLVGLLPFSWERMFAGLIAQLDLQKAVISVVVFLIVLVAAMGIANVLVLTVAEKTQEIAILRALGASARQVLAVFTLEGFALGATGTALGALAGLGVATYFRLQPFPLPGDLYFITSLPVEVQAFDVIWVCGVSLVTSVLASLLPARRAAALRPVEVLR
ncbi:ABC transporter permease [soil metagenome]|nr:ABC transporter permease [Trueperaceae bacterium]